MARAAETAARTVGGLGPPPGPSAVAMSDRNEGPDLMGASEAMRPLAELCLASAAETPFAIGLVGRRGAGKSFALRRLLETVEARARAARPPELGKVVVATVDAAASSNEAEVAIAAAAFAALEAEGAKAYAEFADEAAQAAVGPRAAAAAAAERHDELLARLDQERRAHDEVESRRARIAESLLHETPGARIEAFARASRSRIHASLRRFGFTDGDADFRNLVGELSRAHAGSRLGLFLRAIWAYRGQMGLILWAIFAFALAFSVDRLRMPGVGDRLLDISGRVAPALDWVKSHDETLEYVAEGLIVAGIALLFLNLWRAANFTALMFRGLRLLNIDMRERRRDLDASAARLERRVASLQIEAEAAQQRAEALARRVGAAGPPSRTPVFLGAGHGPAQAARNFLSELGRGDVGAPERLLIALDGLDALAPAQGRRFLEAAIRSAGRNAAVIAAVDLTRFRGDARELAESLFEVVFDVETLAAAAGDDFAARLLSPAPAPAPVPPEPRALTEPLDETEVWRLKTASALLGPRPRALKRFYNAYRLARVSDVPHGALALSLAALMAPDPGPAAALRWALFSEGEALAAPAGSAELAAAFEALGMEGMEKAAARGAFAVARRYAPWG